MKKILPILLLCFCFSATAQTVDDWYFQPPPTDNVMSIVFINGNLIDFVGATLQAFIDNEPVGYQGVFDEDGITGVGVAGTDNLCACDLADSGETIEFSILMNGETIVMVNVNPPVVYYANGFLLIDDNYELTLSIDGAVVVFGCTDAAYLEFDASANLDDSSCSVLVAEGCTDGAADNFDVAANTEDGSCLFTGCMDADADNYDSNANVYGYCQYLGCMDATACNYDANANEDDATCLGLIGCMDPAYYEFDVSATCDDGSCASLIVPGCTDETAFNFNPSATEDDGSCVDIVVGCMNPAMDNFCQECNTDEDPSLCFFSDPNPWGPNGGSAENPTYITANSMSVLVQAGVTSTLDDFSDMDVGDILFAVYETSRLVNDWVGYSEVSGVQIAGAVLWNGDQLDIPVYGTENVYDNGFEQGENITWLVLKADGMIYNIQMKDAQGNPITISWGTGELAIISGLTISAPYYDGCMDATAPNYKPLATVDDGSCEIPYSIGCMDEGALNFAGPGASPTFTNAENFGDVYGQNIGINLNSGYEFSSGIAANIHDQSFCQSQVLGCTNSVMFNYNTLATEDDGSCYPYIYGCTDVDALNYIPLIGDLYVDVNTSDAIDGEDGSCFVSDCCCLVEDLTTTCGWSLDLDCAAVSYCNVCDPCEILVVEGCTSPCFTEYNAEAEVDDGSCNNEIIFGCSCCVNSDGSWPLAAICGDQSTCYCDETYVCETGALAIYGCVDEFAFNYDSQATVYDGSCIAFIEGCTYLGFFNYNSAANTDDGSCVPFVFGCTDPTASNYNPLVNTDDGSCEYPINCEMYCCAPNPFYDYCETECMVIFTPCIDYYGCTDITACNFNSEVTEDDLSCVYAVEFYNCDETCLNDADGDLLCDENEIDAACGDAYACNYYELPVTTDIDNSLCTYAATNYDCDGVCLYDFDADGICDEYEIEGCTDPVALNFYEWATDDDGSCEFVVYVCSDTNYLEYYFNPIDVDFTSNQGEGNCTTPITSNGITASQFDEPLNTGANMTIPMPEGMLNQFEGGQIAAFYGDLCVGLETISGGFMAIGLWGDDSSTDEIDGLLAGEVPTFAVLYNGGVISLDQNELTSYQTNGLVSITNFQFTEPLGCTSATACNYSAYALIDDGTCFYSEEYYDCEGECVIDTDNDGICDELEIPGCTVWGYNNYNDLATDDDGTCIVSWQEDYINLGLISDVLIDSIENEYANYNLVATATLDSLQNAYNLLEALSISIDLLFGWNIIGYTNSLEHDVVLALAEIEELIIVFKDNNADVYLPEYGFNGIGNLIPGQGYQIKLSEPFNNFSFENTLILGCTDALACNYNEQANLDDSNCTYETETTDCDGNQTAINYEIGDLAEGGIVFYIDETGEHGLVAALEDSGQFEWGCNGTAIDGADGTAIGTGYQNTLDIVDGCSETPIAASEALAYESGDYSDWYLPSKDELLEMYNSIGNGGPEGNIGGFINDWYWSSSEYGSNDASVVNFGNGYAGNGSVKDYTRRVRVIRAF